MQGGETPYTVAKTKEVCEELQPPEMKNQPDVRSDSAYHKFVTVSTIFDMPFTMCKVIISLSLYIKETIQGVSKRFQSFKVALLGQDRVAIVRGN